MSTETQLREWVDYEVDANIHFCAVRNRATPQLVIDFRTSEIVGRSGCKLELEHFSALAAKLADVPQSYVETPEVVCYSAGVGYRYHTDLPWRTHTFLLYLNDDYEGGETEFRDELIKPRAGWVLHWRNAIDGQIVTENEHQVRPVTRGQKWVAVCWVWDRPVEDVKSGMPPQGWNYD